MLRRFPSDPDGAKGQYRRALELAPTHSGNLGNYANFLKQVRGDNDGAEEHYKRSLEADPNYVIGLGNYVGFLLGLGRLDEGMDLLDRAISAARFTKVTGLQAECWLYLYANGLASRRDEALVELKRVLVIGDRSGAED